MPKTPFLLVGDAPHRPTGLSRILTDVALRTEATLPELDVRTCGYVPWAGLPRIGTQVDKIQGVPVHLKQWVFNDIQADWGAGAIVACWRKWWGDRPGILLTMWDASWCHAYQKLPLPVQKWGYFPVDAYNVQGTFSGPPAEAIRAYDRVAAYNRYGAEVLARVVAPETDIPHLPLGIDGETFHSGTHPRPAFFPPDLPGRVIIGCVATNASRKDWGMVCQTVQYLRQAGKDVWLWAHVDRLVGDAWSLPQLFMDLDLEASVVVTTHLTDTQLAAAYAHCRLTIAPGRGEGHGYPIVESLAVGTPVIHCAYAGGADILRAAPGWLVAPELFHLVGPYALRRPILSPSVVAQKVAEMLKGGDLRRETQRELALAIGEGYAWTHVWPQWEQWVRQGLEGVVRAQHQG